MLSASASVSTLPIVIHERQALQAALVHLISCLWIPYEKKRAFTPSTKPEGTSKATGATCRKGLCAMT